MDPLAEKYTSTSPYAYVLNNPLQFIDPDGRQTESIHKNKNGNIIAEIDDGDYRTYTHNDLELDEDKGNIEEVAATLFKKRMKHGRDVGGEWSKMDSALRSWGRSIKRVFSFSVSEGEQQQHSGENWYIYGKGSPSGYTIKAPKPDPNGTNKNIDISDMLTPGRWPQANAAGRTGDFIQNIQGLGDNKIKKRNTQTTPNVVDSSCFNCGRSSSEIDVPHYGLPYIRVDSKNNTIDTVKNQ